MEKGLQQFWFIAVSIKLYKESWCTDAKKNQKKTSKVGKEMEIKMQNIRIYGIPACNMASSGIEMGYHTPIEGKSGRSFWSVGSPPVTQTPSNMPRRFFRKEKKSSSLTWGQVSAERTRGALWQNGQRKLQAPTNAVQARCKNREL